MELTDNDERVDTAENDELCLPQSEIKRDENIFSAERLYEAGSKDGGKKIPILSV
jgi:hypothetical protein